MVDGVEKVFQFFSVFKGTVEKNGDLGKPLVAATAFFDERKEMPVVLRNP